jgi:serine/threonine protein kinase
LSRERTLVDFHLAGQTKGLIEIFHASFAMPNSDQPAERTDAPSTEGLIDALCDRFESAWKTGAPRIEDFLDGVADDDRETALIEMLRVELELRRKNDGAPTLGEYRQRFPEYSAAVAMAFEQSKEKQAVTIAHDSKPRSSGLHIRCPHCSNPVELLNDTPLESITCRTCGSAFSLVDQEQKTRESPTLKRIGRFELVARLGMGGFGTVWKARDTELDRTVALKIPRKGQLSPEDVEQFFREARSAAQLRHPNIVPIHEVGRDEETIFIVSDLIRGVALSDWLSGAVPSTRDVAQLLATVADAVHHAHQQGVIHRDLKPSNILLDDEGRPHVMDFGLAKREVGEITMTVDGNILGTPAYMSPEQAGGQGHWTDRRTDVYSLGVILFRMITGELPFRGNAQMQIHQRLTEDPPDPRTLNRHLPRDLCTICLKCLERDPNGRYSTAKELAEELRRFLRHEPIQARPVSRVERVLRWSKRNPALAALATLTAFLAIAGPLAAVAIETQRRRLSELISEKDHLIEQSSAAKQSDVRELTRLRDNLDLWEGRANPWQIWPPKSASPPSKTLMEQAIIDAEQTVQTLSKSSDLREQAFGHLALAIMCDDIGRKAEATKEYTTARDLLAELAAREPATVQYRIALADCHRQLSRLRMDNDREAAKQDLDKARSLTRQLATEIEDPRVRARLYNTELESAVMPGFAGASDHLDRAKQIGEQFRGQVPRNPEQLYELACFLSGREPILTSYHTEGKPK